MALFLKHPMGTHCNASHCAWRDAQCLSAGSHAAGVTCGSSPGVRLGRVDPHAWRRDVQELRVKVKYASQGKGLGVFAAQRAGPGRWICSYHGDFLELSEAHERYFSSVPVYVYSLGSGGGAIDARDSTHFSRLINHNEAANLHAIVSAAEKRVDFYAKRPLSLGVELTIDYGINYWRARASRPAAGTDSREIHRLQDSLRRGLSPRTLTNAE
jgi:hypothetical protein